MGKPFSGQDPTRTRPGGSRTETKIAEQSELGSDSGGGDLTGGDLASGGSTLNDKPGDDALSSDGRRTDAAPRAGSQAEAAAKPKPRR